MKEKERYINQVFGLKGNYKEYVFDTYLSDKIEFNECYKVLNQQDKRIKELEEENQQLIKALNGEVFINYKLPMENAQLKQQLHDLPKKIVEYFYDEIRHRAILEDDYCPDHNLERKYGVRKCLLEDIRTTILKKFGGDER